MHMLFVVRCDPFKSPSGTEIFAGNLAIELSRQGHAVNVIYEGRSNAESMILKSKNLDLYELQLIGIPYVRAIDFRRKCSMCCAKLVSEFHIDAIIAFGSGTFPGYIFERIKKLKDSPLLVYYAMDSMMMEYERSRASNEAKGSLTSFERKMRYAALIKSDKASCFNSDLILASSKDTANHLIADYGVPSAKINLLYEGIPDDFAVGQDTTDPKIPAFLHIAGGPRKGTDFFLKAMKLLEDKYGMKAKAVIIRASQFNAKQAEAFGIEVDAYRYLSTLELKRQYASCTAFVSPSLSEGFCLPIIEAAMFGKPSVVTNVGSLPELVTNGENGFVVPVADVNILADRLHRIAINTEIRKKMGNNARKCAESFTITNTASNLLTVVKEFKR